MADEMKQQQRFVRVTVLVVGEQLSVNAEGVIDQLETLRVLQAAQDAVLDKFRRESFIKIVPAGQMPPGNN